MLLLWEKSYTEPNTFLAYFSPVMDVQNFAIISSSDFGAILIVFGRAFRGGFFFCLMASATGTCA